MIAEFELDTPALRSALQEAPSLDVSIVQQTVPNSGALDIVLNAVRGEFEAFESGLDDDDTVADWLRFTDGDETRRYRVTLTEEGRDLSTYPSWSESGALFLDGHRRRDSWRFRIQFPDEASLQRYVSYCENHGIDCDPVRLSRTDGSALDKQFGLTSIQSQTLVNASQRGFFEIPRECTVEELAAEFDITHQALS
jgi:predicted DNA binding protein